MLTLIDKQIFQTHGLIHLKRFLNRKEIKIRYENVLNVMNEEGAWDNEQWVFDQAQALNDPYAGADLVRKCHQHRIHLKYLITDELLKTIAELLDHQPLSPLADNPQLLFTLPNAERWSIPSSFWHVDIPRMPYEGVPGIQLFTFLNDVAPGGGGTLAVTGSHRLINENARISSLTVRKKLMREPYFQELMSGGDGERDHFLQPQRVGEFELQVVEMHGEPGDVYLMDLRLLHTIAPNATQTPRMMVTQRYLLESLREVRFN